MNPNRGENVQMEVPVAQQEGSESAEGQQIEARPAYQESAPGKQTSTPVTTPATVALPSIQPPVTPSKDDATPDNQIRGPEAVHENNRMEKQWVDKAKIIVARTKDDPYQQNNQISKVKADYMRTRFNKIVHTKTGDS